jgi:hypothetical protein
MTMRERSTSSASPSSHRRLERLGSRGERYVVKRIGKLVPVCLLDLASGVFIQRAADQFAEGLGIDLIEGNANNPAARNEAGVGEVEQSRQQLAPRQISGRPDEHHDLRIPGSYTRWNLCHASLPDPDDEQITRKSLKLNGRPDARRILIIACASDVPLTDGGSAAISIPPKSHANIKPFLGVIRTNPCRA